MFVGLVSFCQACHPRTEEEFRALISFCLISSVRKGSIIIINPLTARVVGAPQIILQPVFAIFPVLHCPLGLSELQACPFLDVVFPPLPLSVLSDRADKGLLRTGKFEGREDGWSGSLLDKGKETFGFTSTETIKAY